MVTDKQVKKLFKLRSMGMTKTEISDKTNMNVKTARKYLSNGKLPSQVKQEHQWRTREDSFDEVWKDVMDFLDNNPGLQGKTLFEHLQKTYPGKFQDGQLRTLQRKIKSWRATAGPAKEVYFEQDHKPGRLCASDFTDMDDLRVSIGCQLFNHKVYHFVLTYSNWETGTICFSESFESLSTGFQNALWELGGVPREHRTDRLSAAVNNLSDSEEFTQKYKQLLDHYHIKGRKTQPASPHENGDVEQSHYRYKTAIDQALMMRGSRNFETREDYEHFLKMIFDQRNSNRKAKLAEEMRHMQELPARRIEDYSECVVRVSIYSTIRIKHNTYSVASRLIGEEVRARLHVEHVDIFYGQKKVDSFPRLMGKNNHSINYRHVIDSLIRKPGAFENYKYKNDLFPTVNFRIAYDALKECSPAKASREYLGILSLASKEGEELVNNALRMMIDNSGAPINVDEIRKIVSVGYIYDVPSSVRIPDADIRCFDELLAFEPGDLL